MEKKEDLSPPPPPLLSMSPTKLSDCNVKNKTKVGLVLFQEGGVRKIPKLYSEVIFSLYHTKTLMQGEIG